MPPEPPGEDLGVQLDFGLLVDLIGRRHGSLDRLARSLRGVSMIIGLSIVADASASSQYPTIFTPSAS